jgi:hypothetical protein
MQRSSGGLFLQHPELLVVVVLFDSSVAVVRGDNSME